MEGTRPPGFVGWCLSGGKMTFFHLGDGGGGDSGATLGMTPIHLGWALPSPRPGPGGRVGS